MPQRSRLGSSCQRALHGNPSSPAAPVGHAPYSSALEKRSVSPWPPKPWRRWQMLSFRRTTPSLPAAVPTDVSHNDASQTHAYETECDTFADGSGPRVAPAFLRPASASSRPARSIALPQAPRPTRGSRSTSRPPRACALVGARHMRTHSGRSLALPAAASIPAPPRGGSRGQPRGETGGHPLSRRADIFKSTAGGRSAARARVCRSRVGPGMSRDECSSRGSPGPTRSAWATAVRPFPGFVSGQSFMTACVSRRRDDIVLDLCSIKRQEQAQDASRGHCGEIRQRRGTEVRSEVRKHLQSFTAHPTCSNAMHPPMKCYV